MRVSSNLSLFILCMCMSAGLHVCLGTTWVLGVCRGWKDLEMELQIVGSRHVSAGVLC